jgi:hypothetical protein
MDRYIRLTIPLAFIIAFCIAFVPLLGHYSQSQLTRGMALFSKESCSTHGWTLLLYVNNFFEGANNCIGWYSKKRIEESNTEGICCTGKGWLIHVDMASGARIFTVYRYCQKDIRKAQKAGNAAIYFQVVFTRISPL